MRKLASRARLTGFVAFSALCALSCSLVPTVLAAPATAKTADSFGWKVEYDDGNRVTRVTDPAGRDTRLQYSFDGARRLRKLGLIRTAEPSVTREFDELGRLTRMTDGAGAVSYGYDARGRLIRVERQGTPAVGYAYDTRDRITRLQVGDFYRVDYTYDFLGRLESMKTPAGVIRYDYLTGQGQLMRTLPNGIRTIWEYEPNGRLRQITHADSRNVILAEYTYEYRPDGLIKAIRERSASGQFVKSYEYDLVGRLVKASGPAGQQYSYEYDTVGNRTKAVSTGKPTQTYTYDWAGRMTAVDGKPTEHDAAGNLTSVTVAGKTLRYRHNQDGQLAEVLDGKVSYRYDGDGNLIGRSAAGVETSFIPDPRALIWRPLVMIAKGGERALWIWEGSTPLVVIRNAAPEWLLHDHVGSVRLVADDRGRPTRSYDYEAFGAPAKPELATAFGPHFSGLYWDSFANIYLTRVRGYLPAAGQMLQPDPKMRIPSPGDTSQYAYALANPVNLVDLDGAEPQRPVALDAGAIWWNAFSQEASLNKVFDKDSAMKTYAMFAESHLAYAQGSGVAAGLTATLLDLAAGFIGGKPQTTSQGIASLAWSFVPIANLNWANKVASGVRIADSVYSAHQVASGVAIGRTAVNYWYAMANHKFGDAAWELSSLGITGAGKLAERVPIWAIEEQVLPKLWKVDLPWPDLTPSEYRAWLPVFVKGIHGTVGFVGKAAHHAFDPRNSFMATDNGPSLQVATPSTARSGTNIPRSDEDAVSGFRLGTHFQASSIPLSGDELLAWRKSHAGNSDGGGGGPSMSPSRVGGVYLGGSGQSLAAMGQLDGIALNQNSNLVLIGKGGAEIKLPPLRLDDVVTIFRSVYFHGEGPTVTIDPNPENPEGSAMIIRHGKATANTYVGWVLYQADRLMKGHTLGIDNVTGKDVTTRVPGYAEVLNTIYFGGESPERLRKQGHWERFWIVPAETRRFVGPKNELTLFDVPLEVKTQSMKWEKGELVDDLHATSSPGALAFRQWFTANYDLIARERFLTPPKESGISGPVPVFTELRRIALITAIAERLRDQGVPLPFWMREYEVRPVPFEKFTPGLEVTRSNQRVTARIYGGVNLSVADKDARTYSSATDLSKATPRDAVVVRQNLALAGALEAAVRPLASMSEPVKVRTVSLEGRNYQATALPGAETLALAPARLQETDLLVPVPGGDPIRLLRSYNSFFNPSGPWGQGWALDLPRLDQVGLPVRRTDKGVEFQIAYELVTPLNSVYARFSRVANVPALNGSRLQVPDQPGDFLGLADAKPGFLSGPTRQLIRKDGGVWHFSKSGELVATEQDGSRVVYERDGKGRLTRIVGLLGQRPVATIDLRYDAAGRIDQAAAKANKQEATVHYEYDAAGKLTGVVSGSGRLGYRYAGSLVTEITGRSAGGDPKKNPETVLRRFEYGPRGRLTAETGANGARTEYRVTTDATGSIVTAVRGDKTARSDVVRYDPALRPVRAQYADGTQASWSYPQGGGTVIDLTSTDGRKLRLAEAADQRSRTVQLAPDRKFVAQYDDAGRLTSLADNGLPVLRQTWSPGGRLLKASDDTTAANLEYDADGLLARVLLAPPGERGTFKTWQATRLDAAGRPLEVTDYRGLQEQMSYGSTGQLQSAVTRRDGNNYGFQVGRDDAGRIRQVKSSWGTSRYAYDASGLLSRVEVESTGQKSFAEWESGRLRKVRQFDGGEFSLAYYQDQKRAGLPKQIVAPNRLVVAYDYDSSNRLSQVAVGSAYRVLLDYDAKGRLTRWSYAAAKH